MRKIKQLLWRKYSDMLSAKKTSNREKNIFIALGMI